MTDEQLGPGITAMLPSEECGNAPVLVACGWMGAQDKHLAKYCALAAELGVPSVRYTAEFWGLVTANTSKYREEALALMRATRVRRGGSQHVTQQWMTSMARPSRSVAFLDAASSWHAGLMEGRTCTRRLCSSGPGAARVSSAPPSNTAERITEPLPTRCPVCGAPGRLLLTRCLPTHRAVDDDLKLDAVVFDSAPAYVSIDSCCLGSTEGMRPGLGKTIAYWAFRAVYTLWFRLGDAGIATNRSARFWATMLDAPAGRPELYLYSDADKITDSARLLELVQHRGEVKRADVQTREFPSSAHVCHLRNFPEQYKAAWASFLREKCGAEVRHGRAEEG